MSIEAHQEGRSAQNPSEKIIAPWTFNVKFSYNTQFTFESLTFTAGKDENLNLLTQSQHQSASHRYMDKLHIFWPSHLH
jgi:hypothetical protein